MKAFEGGMKDLKRSFKSFKQDIVKAIEDNGIEVPTTFEAANPPTVSTVSGESETMWKAVPETQRLAIEKLMAVMERKVNAGEHLEKSEAEGLKNLIGKDGSLLTTVLKLVHTDSKVGSGGIPTQPKEANRKDRGGDAEPRGGKPDSRDEGEVSTDNSEEAKQDDEKQSENPSMMEETADPTEDENTPENTDYEKEERGDDPQGKSTVEEDGPKTA